MILLPIEGGRKMMAFHDWVKFVSFMDADAPKDLIMAALRINEEQYEYYASSYATKYYNKQ